jgi:undecaprenyl-diphosphatase
MTPLQALLLGIIEGLTEFLPISSTGHLTLASHFLGIVQSDQFIVFEIAIQCGAILAVLCTFFKRFFDKELIIKLAIAFLPTGILGLLVYKHIKALLSSELVVAIALILGGVALIGIEKLYARRQFTHDKTSIAKNGGGVGSESGTISYKQAFFLGLAQSVAMIPGVSRSGATIGAGLLMNLERRALVEFTFLLAVPTMAIATLYSLYKQRDILSTDYLGLILLGSTSAFLVALLVIRLLLSYIKKYDFIPFGVYRIIFGFLLLLFWL